MMQAPSRIDWAVLDSVAERLRAAIAIVNEATGDELRAAVQALVELRQSLAIETAEWLTRDRAYQVYGQAFVYHGDRGLELATPPNRLHRVYRPLQGGGINFIKAVGALSAGIVDARR